MFGVFIIACCVGTGHLFTESTASFFQIFFLVRVVKSYNHSFPPKKAKTVKVLNTLKLYYQMVMIHLSDLLRNLESSASSFDMVSASAFSFASFSAIVASFLAMVASFSALEALISAIVASFSAFEALISAIASV